MPTFYLFQTKIGKYILVAFLSLATIFCTFKLGANQPLILLIACLTITVTRITLGSRDTVIAIFVIAFAMIFQTGISVDLSAIENWIRSPVTSSNTFLYLIILVIITISWFANQQIWNILQRVRVSEQKLEQERNSLEIKIVERTQKIKELQINEMQNLINQAQIGEMARGIFHDLLNPLTSVSLYIEEMANTDNPSKGIIHETNEYIKMAISSAKKMRVFLDSVGKHVSSNSHFKIFNPCEEIRDAILLMSYKARNRNVSLHHYGACCQEKPSVQIFGNPLDFHRIILNLVSNAIDACEYNPTKKHYVKVGVSIQKSHVQIVVADNGKGIKQDDLLTIFDLNWSGKQSINQPLGHSGIGLSLVKDMVENNFTGKVKVESRTTSPMSGTIFTLTLPRIT